MNEDIRIFVEAPRIIYTQAKADGRLVEGKNLEELRSIALSQNGVVETQFGSLAADSDPTSRAAPKTKDNIDYDFGEEEINIAKQAIEVLSKGRVLSLDAIVGESEDITVRFLMPERYAQIAYGLKLLFGEPREKIVENPTYHIIFFTDSAYEPNKKIKDVREKDVTIRLWMGDKRGEQVKICRNSTYLGEAKKGVFQFEDWRVKNIDKKGIFLHAGARRDCVWVYSSDTKRPELTEIVTTIAGLTATGKTTLLCRKLARLPRETSEMVGEDGGTFGFDGSFTAFEKEGIYAKTDRVNEDQIEIFRSATSKETYLENVSLSKYPYIPDFSNTSKTKNGRAVVLRKNLGIASNGLRVEKVHNIIILTRNPLINAVSRLTHEQATMQFIYGESEESSGGIEADEGKFKRVFFLDPFAVGDKLKHALTFYEFLKKNPHIKCYLLNTGHIGEDNIKITLRDSLAILNDFLRDSIKFSNKPDELGYYYPIKCDRANLDKLTSLDKFKPDSLKRKVDEFLKSRRTYLEKFESENGPIPSIIRESLRYK